MLRLLDHSATVLVVPFLFLFPPPPILSVRGTPIMPSPRLSITLRIGGGGKRKRNGRNAKRMQKVLVIPWGIEGWFEEREKYLMTPLGL